MFRSKLEPSVKASDPVFNKIVDAIRADKPIVYSKINHGFWERLVAIEAAGYPIDEQNAIIAKEMDNLDVFLRPTPYMFEGGFVRELLDVLTSIPKNESDYIFAASLLAWPGRLEIAGLGQDERLSQAMIDRLIPQDILHPVADGMEVKRALVNGTFVNLSNALKTRKTLLIGNSNLSRFLEFIGVENGRFLEIHPTDARGSRVEILRKILETVDSNTDFKVILLQAGGSLSAWLAYHINKVKPQVSLIDIGLGSLICKPEALLKTAFGRVYANQLITSVHAVSPSWIYDNYEGLVADETFTGRSNKVGKLLKTSNVPVRKCRFDPTISYPAKVPFTLAKPVDEIRVEQIMNSDSEPSDMAISVLKQVMGLPKTDEIVICKSEESAFTLASKIVEIDSGDQELWLVDPYLEILPKSNIRLLDTNESGLMSRDIVNDHIIGSSQNFIFSNLFGGSVRTWNRIRHLSMKLGFSLIIDNRNGFLDRPQSERPSSEIEIVSGAALQSWGIHGCSIIILSEQRAKLAKSILRMEELVSQRKCAEWIDHLERYPRWSFFYFRQAQRLRQIISRNLPGFSEYLPEFPTKSPIGSLQYLCPKPILENQIENKAFDVKRALPSVPKNFPNAKFLSDHVISIPCHPFMRHVSKEDIIESLGTLS